MGTLVMNEFSSISLSERSSASGDIIGDNFKSHLPRPGYGALASRQRSIPVTNFSEILRQQELKNSKSWSFLGIQLTSSLAEHVLFHPFLVLRRQCQIHHSGARYHLTPISLLSTAANITGRQGKLVFWKGLTGVHAVNGICLLSEAIISASTGFPRMVTRHCPCWKLIGHVLLKSFVFAIATPFLAVSLVDTVRSDIVCTRSGFLDILTEGAARIGSWNLTRHSRQLPLWKLVLPSVVFMTCHYILKSIAEFTVNSSMHIEQQEARERSLRYGTELSVYDTHFPGLVASFTGGFLADVLTYPMETVLHRLYVQGTRTIIDNPDTGLSVLPVNTNYQGFLDCFRGVLREEGVRGLYRGFGALLLQYAVYAIVLRLIKMLLDNLREFHPSRRPSRTSSPAVKPRNFRAQEIGHGEGLDK